MTAMVKFSHGEAGLTRFPPNIEQITVESAEGEYMWLVVRRNDVVLRFPLEEADRHHLAMLLAGLDPTQLFKR